MCPECGDSLIPIHYGEVSYAEIEMVIAGLLHVANRYALENFYCKTCKNSLKVPIGVIN